MNVVVAHAQGRSTLVPTAGPLDLAGNWEILDLEGEPLFAGTLAQCEQYMLAEGLRPDCNCELVDVTASDCWPELGWDSF